MSNPGEAGGPGDELDLVPARMVNETLYCERLLALEWGRGEFRDNEYTVEGRRVHRRADQPSGQLPDATADASGEPIDAQRPIARSVWLSSERLGLTARIDVVDSDAQGCLIPIEYKRGRAPDLPQGAWLPERAQLCVHVLLLRDHGHRVEHAEIYYAAERRRVRIDIDQELIDTTLRAAARARAIAGSAELPPPLQDSPKCPSCSLVSICLPDEVRVLQAAGGDDPLDEPRAGAEADSGDRGDEPDSTARAPAPASLRPIAVKHDIALPLYVVEHGAMVAKKDNVIEVRKDGEVLASMPLLRLSQVSVFANAQVTVGARNELAERGIPVCQFTSGGWFRSVSHGFPSTNVFLRLAQFRAATDPQRSLEIARRFVAGKVRNARTLLRRNTRDTAAVLATVRDLREAQKSIAAAPSLGSLLGVEGNAARLYFGSFSWMIRRDPTTHEAQFDFTARNRRPPRDPVNALLSFVYALLVKDLTATLLAVGFDPCLGFYHQPRHGRPSLALDLAEEFRPLIGDSVVLQVINNGEVGARDFVIGAESCGLTASGRRQVLAAYERRLQTEVTHPLFGYSLSYRRVFEMQARLLARSLEGEIPVYPPFVTR